MKKVVMASGAALALMAGSAMAGGCNYGKVAELASVDKDAVKSLEVEAASEVQDPRLVAMLKEKEVDTTPIAAQ